MDAHRQAALDFLTLVAAGRVDEAFERHVGAGFRHHNPFFRGDAGSLRAAMAENAAGNPDKRLEVQQAIAEGDRVAVFSRVRQRPGERGAAVVHLFRFEAGRIVELWDVGQPVPDDSHNEHGMF